MLQDLGVKSCHTVTRDLVYDRHIGHAHLAVP